MINILEKTMFIGLGFVLMVVIYIMPQLVEFLIKSIR
jgi:hypothetical protein